MNFFEQQARARRNTTRLVVLLLLAIASLILVTTALFAGVMFYLQTGNSHFQMQTQGMGFWASLGTLVSWQLIGGIALVVVTVVFFGGLFKYLQLQGGGRTVAESLGGRLINGNTTDPDERKILNVVEEMAIASGTAVPPVFLLEETAINAFAAGLTPEDAVIGITRGCIQQLDRDQLQGVIAHEFSHIFHGDMRLNMRLVAILNGILLLGLIGHFITRSASYRSLSRSGKDNNQGGLVLLGIGLMIIGYAGTFFGNIIKSAVSRQREFLADASAVQFTRNPEGIAGALKRIGGYAQGSKLDSSHSAEFSHMYFSQGISTAFNALMATHPPLTERIRRIEPRWDGLYLEPQPQSAPSSPDVSAADHATTMGFTERQNAVITGAAISDAINQIGAPSPQHLQTARIRLDTIGADIRHQAQDVFSVRGLIFGLLLDRDTLTRKTQLQLLGECYSNNELQTLKNAMTNAYRLEENLRLPLLELCLPTLKTLSAPQREVFLRAIDVLIEADNEIRLMEWTLRSIIIAHLNPTKAFHGDRQLRQQRTECALLLSFMAHTSSSEPAQVSAAFSRATHHLRLGALELLPLDSLRTQDLDHALDSLNRTRALQKPQLLKAMVAGIESDGVITVSEAELFRAVADSLGCPVPLILPSA